MTVTRLGQLTGELQTLADVSPIGGSSSLPVISSAKARTGTYSYRNSFTSATAFGITFPAQEAVRCGFWLNHNGISGTTGTPGIVLLQVGTSRVRVEWTRTGLLRLLLGYVVNSSNMNLAASAPEGTFGQVNTWKHVGLTYRCAAEGGFCSVYVDGVQVLNFVGDTTIYPANSNVKTSGIVGAYVLDGSLASYWSNDAFADDFYVDSYAGEVDAPPSSRRFLFGRVDGAGAQAAQWTAAGAPTTWECVDEAAPDGDTTYAKALTAGLRDQYAAADVAVPADHVVRAVLPVCVARKTDAGLDSRLKLGLATGADVRLGDAQALPTSYGVRWDRFAAQADGAAWTEAAVNAQQVVAESAGAF